MNEAKHTEGTWRSYPLYPTDAKDGVVTVHREQGVSHYGISANYQDEQDRRCTVIIGQAILTYGRDTEAEANARLMAAAPDMLAVTKQFVAWLIDGIATERSIADIKEKALAAIAKATGEPT